MDASVESALSGPETGQSGRRFQSFPDFLSKIFSIFINERAIKSHCIFLKEKSKDGFSYLIFVIILDSITIMTKFDMLTVNCSINFLIFALN